MNKREKDEKRLEELIKGYLSEEGVLSKREIDTLKVNQLLEKERQRVRRILAFSIFAFLISISMSISSGHYFTAGYLTICLLIITFVRGKRRKNRQNINAE